MTQNICYEIHFWQLQEFNCLVGVVLVFVFLPSTGKGISTTKLCGSVGVRVSSSKENKKICRTEAPLTFAKQLNYLWYWYVKLRQLVFILKFMIYISLWFLHLLIWSRFIQCSYFVWQPWYNISLGLTDQTWDIYS